MEAIVMVEPHKHCPVCSTPIPMDEITCSERCQEILSKNQQRVRRTRMIFYLVFALFIVVWVVLSIRG